MLHSSSIFHDPSGLPPPSPEAVAHGFLLADVILQAIEKNQGKITFEQFMELALYAPGLGYYSAGSHKIGAQGDFITAPEISPLFSYAVARQCEEILGLLNGGDILEFGGGSGQMALDILSYLRKRQALPRHYFILETSAQLQARQRETFEKCDPDLLACVQWISSLPCNFQGIMLANEVLDAFPVHRFLIQQKGVQEYYVEYQNNKFIWATHAPSSERLKEEILCIKRDFLSDARVYTSEINLRAAAWINSLNDSLAKGVILLIDYGFPRPIYYHPQRLSGTLMCHYRHRSHPDPLILIGLQDITAHVDFSFVAECAQKIGLAIGGYTAQGAFLLQCGLLELADIPLNTVERISISRQIQILTMPHEMGELFKVLLLSKNIEGEFLGFSNRNG